MDEDEDEYSTTLIGAARGDGGNLLLLANVAPLIDDPDAIQSVVMDFDPSTRQGEIVQEFDGWLTSLMRDDKGKLYAVSADGELVSLSPATPVARDLRAPAALNGLYAVPGAGAIAVGDEGALIRLPTLNAAPVAISATQDLYAAAAWSDRAMVVVGDKGTVLYGDGQTWRPIIVPTNVCLYAVLMSGESNFYVAGVGGVMFEFNPNGIAAVDLPRDLTVYEMARYRDAIYLACGEGGVWVLTGGSKYEKVSEEQIYSILVVADLLVGLGNNIMLTFAGSTWSRFEIDV